METVITGTMNLPVTEKVFCQLNLHYSLFCLLPRGHCMNFPKNKRITWHNLITSLISISQYTLLKMSTLKSHIQRMREVNVSVWARVSHSNFSRSLAEHCAGRVVPVAIVGNILMWKLKPHATRWTTMERRKAHTSRFRAKPCLSTPSLNTKPCCPYEITSMDVAMSYMTVRIFLQSAS